MQVKIVSDGFKTSVINAETGEAIEKVRAVSWSHSVGEEVAVATIEVILPRAEVQSVSAGLVEIPVTEISKNVTVNVAVNGLRKFKVRGWLAIQLFRMGALISPLKVEVSETYNEQTQN